MIYSACLEKKKVMIQCNRCAEPSTFGISHDNNLPHDNTTYRYWLCFAVFFNAMVTPNAVYILDLFFITPNCFCIWYCMLSLHSKILPHVVRWPKCSYDLVLPYHRRSPRRGMVRILRILIWTVSKFTRVHHRTLEVCVCCFPACFTGQRDELLLAEYHLINNQFSFFGMLFR